MPVGKYASTPSAQPSVGTTTPESASETPMAPTMSSPQELTPRSAVVDAVTKDLDKAVLEGKHTENRVKSYRDALADAKISLEHAQEICEAVLIEGVYTEEIALTKKVSVQFRSRDYADTQRYLQAVEAYQPRYEQERAEISLRYFLAASIMRYRDTHFEYADPRDPAAAQKAFDARHAWLMAQPEVLIRHLAEKLHQFDVKLALVVREGMIENF